MNKNRHRVVFNAARGLRMVVAECARSMGKASTTTARTACTTVTLNLTLVAQLVASLPAHAQIAADP
uniref:ESPR-type extended signal peptide-containing protein n=1 Tax=Hydrogenophaga sp. 2FB TaxID=2502187 RepID=UPI0014859419